MSFPPAGAFDPEEVLNPNAELAETDVGYTGPDIETDEAAIAADVFDDMAERVPGWEANDGNPDTWLIEAFAAITAELRALAADVPAAVLVTHGVEVLGLPIRPPAPAHGYSRWTAEDALGYEIRPGTQVTVARTGDELVGFEVLNGAIIAPGEIEVDDVELVAVEDGADGNGLIGPAEVSDPLDWVQEVVITRPTFDGDNGQTQEEYLDVLTNLLRIVAFRPILPYDFALLSLRIGGVGRAVSMDGYNVIDDSWGHQRRITLVVTRPDGEPLPDATRAEIRGYLESVREVNWIVDVISPVYDDTDVEFEVTAFAEQDPDLVHDICVDAIRQELSPANYRLGTTSPGTAAGEVIPPPTGGAAPGRQTIWINNLIGLLDRCRGVDRVGWVTIDGQDTDKVLGDPITLPRPGTIDGTVNAP
jgi:hypothetical protein